MTCALSALRGRVRPRAVQHSVGGLDLAERALLAQPAMETARQAGRLTWLRQAQARQSALFGLELLAGRQVLPGFDPNRAFS